MLYTKPLLLLPTTFSTAHIQCGKKYEELGSINLRLLRVVVVVVVVHKELR